MKCFLMIADHYQQDWYLWKMAPYLTLCRRPPWRGVPWPWRSSSTRWGSLWFVWKQHKIHSVTCFTLHSPLPALWCGRCWGLTRLRWSLLVCLVTCCVQELWGRPQPRTSPCLSLETGLKATTWYLSSAAQRPLLCTQDRRGKSLTSNTLAILGFLDGLYRLVFNCSAQTSITLFNQQGSFVHQEFSGTESLIGCPWFFILVPKIGKVKKPPCTTGITLGHHLVSRAIRQPTTRPKRITNPHCHTFSEPSGHGESPATVIEIWVFFSNSSAWNHFVIVCHTYGFGFGYDFGLWTTSPPKAVKWPPIPSESALVASLQVQVHQPKV